MTNRIRGLAVLLALGTLLLGWPAGEARAATPSPAPSPTAASPSAASPTAPSASPSASTPTTKASPTAPAQGQQVGRRYLITYRSPATAQGADKKAATGQRASAKSRDLTAKGIAVKQQFSALLPGLVAELDPQQLAQVRSDPDVADVEPDRVVTPAATTTQNNATWGLDRIDQRQGLNGTYTYDSAGAGVDVYVLDSGIYAAHSEFTGRIAAGYNAVGSVNTVGKADANGGNTANTNDCYGHGTHVSGTAAGTTYGVAKKATIIPVRVLDCVGSGWDSWVIGGLDWIAQRHQAGQPAVVNVSLSAGIAIRSYVNTLLAEGVVIVGAAGNAGVEGCILPAGLPGVISVGAVDDTTSLAQWPWASGGSNYGSCVDLYAPGHRITSAVNTGPYNTEPWYGTSMASPHVAGAAARLLSQNPSLTPAQVRGELVSRASANIVKGAPLPNYLLYIGDGTYDPVAQRAAAVSQLGQPTSNYTCGLTNGGCYRDYAGGAVLWSPATGAWESFGPIRDRYRAVGFESSGLSYPTGPVTCGIKDNGCFQNFQGGAILGSPSTGYWANWGSIRDRYRQLGFERSVLGLPIGAEVCGLSGGGCYQNFQGGAILWSPATGAWESFGPTRVVYRAAGFESGRYGYPTGAVACSGTRCSQTYQGGTITAG